MIIKSFYRKNTTKKYLIILMSIFLIFNIIIIGRNYYIEKMNENYSNTFVLINSYNNDLNYKVKTTITYDDIYYILIDNNLSDSEVMIPKSLNKDIIDNKIDIYNVIFDNVVTTDNYPGIFIYMNETKFNLINIDHSFIILVDDFYHIDKLKNELYEKKYDYNICEISKTNLNIKKNIQIFNVLLYLIILIVIIVLIIVIYNVVYNEKNNNKLYNSLGYKKITIVKLVLLKVISLVIVSYLLSFFVSFVISVLI